MSCLNLIDATVLADYWIGALDAKEEERVEEHLFACDECGARLDEVIALAGEVRELAQQGSLMMIVSDAFLKRAAEQGAKVRNYDAAPSGAVHCTVTAEDDLLIAHLAADLAGEKHVDFSICGADGTERLRMADIPFNRGAASVAFQYGIAAAKSAPTETLLARLIGLDDAGQERLIGEYTFHHTRSMPGPAAW